jgi:hypothetical protein
MKKMMILIAVLSIAYFGCKKEAVTTPNINGNGITNGTNNQGTPGKNDAATDNKSVQSQSDEAVNDANNVISNNSSFTGRLVNPQGNPVYSSLPCGVTVDTTLASQGILTLTYDGTTVCYNRKRSGQIKLTLIDYLNGKRWKDAGAVLQMDYTAYKVTRVSDNVSITFDGTQFVTNVTGGDFITLYLGLAPNATNLIHRATATNLKATFDDGYYTLNNLARKFTYTYDRTNGIFACVGEGEGTNNGLSNIENWGKTREGDDFTSQVTTPVVWNTTCGAYAPVKGVVDVKVPAKSYEFIVTFGVDQNGNVVTPSLNNCPYGFKVELLYAGTSYYTVVLGYS